MSVTVKNLMAGAETRETDVLVLGGGLAGTRAALSAARCGQRVIWAYLARGASPYIIGANVPLGARLSGDSAELYAEDMLEGGYGLGQRTVVQRLANQSVAAFRDLEMDVTDFARDGLEYRLRHLSGNRHPRSVFVPEGTGKAVLRGLEKAIEECGGVTTLSGHKVLSLLSGHFGVSGALLAARHARGLIVIRAKTTVLALGGVGQLFGDTTYPADVNGDSAMLALEAGATLIDMEFIQFEPVVTLLPEGVRGMEMPTAMLGDGAHLLNAKGERFMFRYNPGGGERGIEKARMALCIQQEIDQGRGLDGGTVRFDTTTVPPDRLESYVSHCKRLRQHGCEPLQQGPLVRPMAHSVMGGVSADDSGWTGVEGLFVCGEAMGGVHGASRIAGNGGGETMTMGWLVGRAAARRAEKRSVPDVPDLGEFCDRLFHPGAEASATPAAIVQLVRRIMDDCAGLYRERAGLQDGLTRLEPLSRAAHELPARDLAEAVCVRSCRNMVQLAEVVLRAALERTESRGAHQRRDHPDQDDQTWLRHVCIRRARKGGVAVSRGKVMIEE